MSIQTIDHVVPIRHPILRGTGAVLAGLASIFALSIIADGALHATGVYPPEGQPMYDHGLLALALGYRSVFGVIAGYITAWLAPSHKVRHAMILAAIGIAISTLGAVTMWDFAYGWYNIAIIAICIPTAWLGARLYIRNAR